MSTPPGEAAARVFVSGSLGQIGTELINYIRSRIGKDNLTASDIIEPKKDVAPFVKVNVTDKATFRAAVEASKANIMIHNAALLSASGEANPLLCMDVNIGGLMNAMEIARLNNMRILVPSSIAAFGPDSLPKDLTPDVCVLRPNTIYGVSKVYAELLGTYYFNKWGVDFRSLRYPGIISYEQLPVGGTTDYATEMFIYAIKGKTYKCPLTENTSMEFLYMPDCLRGTTEFLMCKRDLLKQCVYNIGGFHMTPKMLVNEIRKHYPEFTVDYTSPCPVRQKIADSWPHSLDDTNARRDWNWTPQFGIKEMVEDMFLHLKQMKSLPDI
eukprot:TRINITY_DN22865_c0_g1_i1.p1 TRINITY_DN22865_c0_g1~~TRINITY_DN22865_c0_g1_i1.p1  ORF type:complete len:326 (-),score=49.85 TRINITY_DN22865_c0_g1_i1:106-1083(-)